MEKLRLEMLPREEVLVYNKIFTPHKRVCFSIGQNEFTLRFHFGKPAFSPEVGIKISVDGTLFWVWLEHNLFKDEIENFLSDEHISELPQGIREAMVEAELEELLDQFDACNGTTTAIREIAFGSPRADGGHLVPFSLTQSQSNKSMEGYLALDRSSLDLLAVLLERVPPYFPFSWHSLPLQANIIIGKTTLLVSDLNEIEKNDIILMDECLYKDQQVVHLYFSPQIYFKAHLHDTVLTIEEMREGAMADESSKPGTEAKSVPTIDGLTIHIVFELGEKKLSLGDLKAMQPGYTFDLEKDPEKPVTVRANGKIIGFGELVEVDGRVGVRLVEVFEHAGG